MSAKVKCVVERFGGHSDNGPYLLRPDNETPSYWDKVVLATTEEVAHSAAVLEAHNAEQQRLCKLWRTLPNRGNKRRPA